MPYLCRPKGSDCGIVNVNIPTSGAEIGGAFGMLLVLFQGFNQSIEITKCEEINEVNFESYCSSRKQIVTRGS